MRLSILIASLFSFVSISMSQRNKESEVIPNHHTDSGFKNNYLPEERMTKSLGTLFKWRFTRNSQEKVKFESVEPDIDFLKSNKTEETLSRKEPQ